MAGVALLTGVVMLAGAAMLAGCDDGGDRPASAASVQSTSPTSPVSSTSTAGVPSAEELLDRAVAWIEAASTQVTFGPYPYTVIYSEGAFQGRLTLPPDVRGEPLVPWPVCWWEMGKDYYFQDKRGPPLHVTRQMGLEMRSAPYSTEVNLGTGSLIVIRTLADPHRLLTTSSADGATRQPGGSWRVEAEVTVDALVDLGLPDEELRLYIDPDLVLRTDLVVAEDGRIQSMSVEWVLPEPEVMTYTWTRTEEQFALPKDWVDLDDYTLESRLAAGWRANVYDASQDVGFPVYWLGDPYQGLVLRDIHVEQDLYVLLEYGRPRDRSTGAGDGQAVISAGKEGLILLQYSESAVPDSEVTFVEDKKLLETRQVGDEVYSVYSMAKGKPARSILVKRGETYISISATGGDTGDGTQELPVAAAALRRADPGQASGPEQPSGGLPTAMPAGFGFVASYGVGAYNVLDTTAGTFTKDLIMAGTVTTPLRLTESEFEDLYRDLAAMDILGYPSQYKPEAGSTGPTRFVTPCRTYKLDLYIGDAHLKTVEWVDEHLWAGPEAEALRAWFAKLKKTVEDKAEWQSLPPAQGGYL
ncbi:MAG: hypothetical protein JXA87_13830 [Thermoleophilia bacterium]|nr:hypothetical protein [Thermoleophilia bacterium]